MVIAATLLASLAAVPAAPSMADAPVTTSDLVEVADIMGPTLSPNGEKILFRISRPSVRANDTRLDWYVADVDGSSAAHAGSAGTVRHDGAGSVAEQKAVWDADSRGFRFLALVDGVAAIWHWREGEGERREVADAADILDFTVSPDGRTLRYTIGATRAEVAAAEKRAYDEGVLIDDSVDLGQAVAGGKIEGGRRVAQRWNRNWFDRAGLLWDAPKKEVVVELGSDIVAHAPRARPSAQDRRIVLAAGGHAEIERAAGMTQLTVVRADGKRILCRAVPCRSDRLAAIAERPGTDMLILFERGTGARETIWLWRIGDPGARYLTATDGAERTPIWQPRCVAAPNALVCAESSAVEPPRLVRIAYADGVRSVIADPNADLRRRIAAVATPLRWRNGHDGILLTPPKSQNPLPLVIQYYRCAGFLKGGVGDEIPMLPLVEHGIAVLCINGQPPTPGEPMEASYVTALAAIGEAIDDLAERKRIDPKRVGIGGLSFGSTVAIWAIRKSKRFAAATISSGQATPHYYWSNALPDRGFAKTFHEFWQAGDPDSDPERWRTISPASDIAAIDTPLLMQLPESEVRNLVEFHTKLKLAGKPAELFAFADEIHIKYQPAHKHAVYERNLDWYRFWLKGEEDPAPRKSGRYIRWRSLRAGQPLQAPAP
jgi:dipeptidyl aminopeptidase/acylaminoacyl peptidase